VLDLKPFFPKVLPSSMSAEQHDVTQLLRAWSRGMRRRSKAYSLLYTRNSIVAPVVTWRGSVPVSRRFNPLR